MGIRGDGVRQETRRGRRVWVIDFWYRDKEGERRRCKRDASVQTAAAAHAEAARFRLRAATTGDPLGDEAPIQRVITFRAFVEGRWRDEWSSRFKPSTRKRYDEMLDDQGLLEHFGALRLDEITTSTILGYASKLTGRKRPGTKIQTWPHVSLVTSIIRAAKALGELEQLPELPPSGKPKKKLPRCPSDEDVSLLIEHALTWVRLVCALAAYAGLRSGEVRALQVGDVSLKRGEIHVCRAISADEVSTTKSDEDRIVPISPELRPLLVLACKGKRARDLVVVTEKGTTPTRQNILNRVKRVQDRHGLRAHSFHALRHYFCTSLIRRGVNVAAVQAVAGHADIETTMQYVHPEADDVRRVMVSTPPAHVPAIDIN